MAVMDADDIAFKDRLRKQVKILDNDPSIAVCGSSMKVERNNSVWYAHQFPENIKVGCVFGNPIPTSTATFRLRHLDQYGLRWDNKFAPCADYHLWYLMLYKHNLRARNTGDVDMIYTHSPIGVSHRNGLIAQEKKDAEIKQLILDCFSLQVSFVEIFSFMKVASYRSSEGKDASGYLNVSRQLKQKNKGRIVDSFALDRAISNRAAIYLIKTQDIPDLVKKDILENLIIKRHFLINIIMNLIIKFKYEILDSHFPYLSYKFTELYSKVRERH
jgi:hypothetical protein